MGARSLLYSVNIYKVSQVENTLISGGRYMLCLLCWLSSEMGSDPWVFVHDGPSDCKCLSPLFFNMQAHHCPLPGPALGEVGEAMRELSEVKDSLDMEVKQNFIDPLQNLHDKDLREIQVSAIHSLGNGQLELYRCWCHFPLENIF